MREDYLRLVEGREKMQSGFSLPIKNVSSPSEGRIGRNCMRVNGIVCYMRNLLSPLQIPIFFQENKMVSHLLKRLTVSIPSVIGNMSTGCIFFTR